MPHHPIDFVDARLHELLQRSPHSHKGDYGRALVVGGSTGMSGAIVLAGKATLRSGAGLVTLLVPAAIQDVVAGHDPCYMTVGLIGVDQEERLDPASMLELPPKLVESADAWAVGPGLGQEADTAEMVARLYRDISQPMVVDADGLNALAHEPDALTEPGGPRILTPHPGEFVRLALAVEPDWDAAMAARSDQQAERQRAANWLAEHDPTRQTTVVLKGHGTVVAAAGKSSVNRTGNPGIATGGSGDILTGVITGLLCQGLSSCDAARLGVHVHGLAGDLAADALGQVSLIASDLIDYLPRAFQTLGK